MRLLVHRGQALLLLAVGGLAGAVVLGAGLEWYGLPAPIAARAVQVMAPRRSHLPARIEIDARPQPEGTVAAAARSASDSVVMEAGTSPPPGTPAIAPSPSTTVVPSTVYAYPSDDHGRGGGTSSGATDRGER